MSPHIESSGVRIEVKGFVGAPLPERKPGEHMWVVLVMFRVNPTADRYALDRENLLSVEGPGCFWCEKKWTPELAAQPCRDVLP